MNTTTKTLLGVGFITTVFILFLIGAFTIDVFETANKIQEFMLSFGVFGPFIFVLLYVPLALIGFPSSIFAIAAGIAYPLWLAWSLDVIASTITAIIAFFIGRRFNLEKFLKKIMSQKRHKKIETNSKFINKHCKKHGFITICLLRLSFIPFIVLSYSSGLVKKFNFKTFIIAIFLTNLLFSFITVYFGQSLTRDITSIIIASFIIVVAFLLMYIFRNQLTKKYFT